MVMAVGLGGPATAMFHLTTHAFFKALLFLGAGSVILALHHEQDIWKMGGLRKKMPVTFWTFLFGMLALCGVPPFSGFYSKDGILAQALARHNYPLFLLAVFVAMLTAFYMFRLFFVAFLGAPKTESAGHAHESPPVMAWPLRVLGVFSLFGGVLGADKIFEAQFLGESAGHSLTLLQRLVEPWTSTPEVAGIGLTAAAIGFTLAAVLYARAGSDPLPSKLGVLAIAMRNRFYFDEIYERTVIRFHDFLSAIADWIDRWIIAGVGVRGVHGTTEFAGRALRLVQTGNLQTYALWFALGVALVLWFVLGK